VLVKADSNGIAIVRTTSSYRASAQLFRPIHEQLAQQISASGLLPLSFNNALVEHYTSAYTTMKRHSDQAQDLADESWIAVYSCYRDPERPSRRLMVQPKESGVGFEVPLEHGSVVVFSLESNRRTRSPCGRPRPTTSGSESPFEPRRPSCASSTAIQPCPVAPA
jgi:hypothetical protein